MCKYNREENKLLGKVGETCSLENIYGKCSKKTMEACIEAETALAAIADPMSKKSIFINTDPINEDVFLPLKFDLSPPSL